MLKINYKNLLFLILLLNPYYLIVYAESGVLYQGKIGQSNITLSLNIKNTDTHRKNVGVYSYDKYKRDIYLYLDQKNTNQLSLFESNKSYFYDNDEPDAQIKLIKKENGNWQGSWKAKGKTLPIDLHPINFPSVPKSKPYLSDFQKEDPYIYLKMTQLKPVKTKVTTFNGVKLQWYKEPITNIETFDIISGYSQTELHFINMKLQERRDSNLFYALSCGFSALVNDYTLDNYPTLVSKDLISIVFKINYSCGAYPDFSYQPLNLSVKQKKELTLEDVLWVGNPKQKKNWANRRSGSPVGNKDFDEYAQYNTSVFAPWLVNKWQKLYSKKMQQSQIENDDVCDYNSTEFWRFNTWFFLDKGIYFEPSAPHVIGVCRGISWSVLPYSEIQKNRGVLTSLQFP